MAQQSTNRILMVRPAAIGSNPETAGSNAFQRQLSADELASAKAAALTQFDGAVATLKQNGVEVLVIPDKPEPPKPDAVFPNNWFSTHEDGRIVLYPMLAPSRRAERRLEVVEYLKDHFGYSEVVDYSGFESQGKFLEGTGSLVLDRVNKVAFAAIGPRTHPDLVAQFCADFGYRPITFSALDAHGLPIYHTNVLLAVGTNVAVVCMHAIKDEKGRMEVAEALDTPGRKTVLIDYDEMNAYSGNMLEVATTSGERRLVMSTSAYLGLTPRHQAQITEIAKPILLSIGAIQDLGGGSARCMMAELFPVTTPKPVAADETAVTSEPEPAAESASEPNP